MHHQRSQRPNIADSDTHEDDSRRGEMQNLFEEHPELVVWFDETGSQQLPDVKIPDTVIRPIKEFLKDSSQEPKVRC